jgi:1-aminocyclopropane-1-carboxylate deaminase
MFDEINTKNIRLNSQIYLKPEYEIHPKVSGNKFRKLKYNIQDFRKSECKGILTFGGAFSNHIAATAAAGNILGFKTLGIIRGLELAKNIENNPTLKYANENGMKLEFISRVDYRKKNQNGFIKSLLRKHPEYYIIPEGGTNDLAVKGCEEILCENDFDFDIICCSVGTGGTISGIINASNPSQKILGFPALKNSSIHKDICKFVKQSNWKLIVDYHFGGYAKVNTELIEFMNDFKSKFKITLDPVYTAKMVYGVFDLIKKKVISNDDKVLVIHTGGLQGIKGMNRYLKKNNFDLIL